LITSFFSRQTKTRKDKATKQQTLYIGRTSKKRNTGTCIKSMYKTPKTKVKLIIPQSATNDTQTISQNNRTTQTHSDNNNCPNPNTKHQKTTKIYHACNPLHLPKTQNNEQTKPRTTTKIWWAATVSTPRHILPLENKQTLQYKNNTNARPPHTNHNENNNPKSKQKSRYHIPTTLALAKIEFAYKHPYVVKKFYTFKLY